MTCLARYSLGILNLMPGVIVGSVYGMSLALHKGDNHHKLGSLTVPIWQEPPWEPLSLRCLFFP